MGLINWWKDKRLNEMIADIKRCEARINTLEMNFASMINRMNRILGSRKRQSEEEDEEDQGGNMEQIIKAFGGDVPIEMREKYKRLDH